MKKRSFIRTFSAILIMVAVLSLIGWVLVSNKKENEKKTALAAQTTDKVSVKVKEVVSKELNLDFSSNGNFQAWREMDFASENSGRIVKILVSEGSRVSPGQTLAIVDADILNINLQNAEAALQNAERDQQRFENAYATGGVTQQQLDQIRLSVDNSEAAVQQAKVKIQNANVRSAISGVVNKKYIEPGAYVSPGTALFQLVDISRLKLVVNVNEDQVTRIKTGDKIQISASVFPDRTYSGEITFIGNQADQALNFPVEIRVDNSHSDLKAGMYGTAQFKVENHRQSLVVPRSAFAGSVSSNELFVLIGDIAETRKVTTGRIVGDDVEILSGLEEGEQVVTSGQINLQNGSKVSKL